jgi:hypothetical protein
VARNCSYIHDIRNDAKIKVMEIINKPGKYAPYKAYKLTENEQHFLNFERDVEILPARYQGDVVSKGKFYFLRRHEVGDPTLERGGV